MAPTEDAREISTLDQLRFLLAKLTGGVTPIALTPGDYVVLVDTTKVSESSWDLLEGLRQGLVVSGIHLYILPLERPDGVKFIQIARPETVVLDVQTSSCTALVTAAKALMACVEHTYDTIGVDSDAYAPAYLALQAAIAKMEGK